MPINNNSNGDNNNNNNNNSNNNNILLTIVIATFNRAASLENCLHSLTKQTDKNFTVLIIDGGSTDKTQKVIRDYKKKLPIQVIIDKTPHLSYIRDLGWRKAKTDLVAWVDDDTIVEKQWVKSIKNAFKAKIGGVTGPTVIPSRLLRKRNVFYCHAKLNNKQKNLSLGKFLCKLYFRLFMQGEKYGIGKIYPSGAWSPGSNFPQSKKLPKPIEVDYLEACNFAVPRKVLEEVNGFNLKYKGTSEWCEVDLAFRIRKAGYKLIFDPMAAVKHRVSKKGAYSRRANPLHRLQNFARFYFSAYYPKTLQGIFLFLIYFQFIAIYFIFIGKIKRLQGAVVAKRE